MKLTPGQIYFIGEEDPVDGSLTPFVKIGIVHDARESEKRLAEHQTGNPKRLHLLRVLPSPVIDRMETLVLAESAPSRVGGEWFHLPGVDLEEVVDRTVQHIDEALDASCSLDVATKLAKKPSNGEFLIPDSEMAGLHRRLLDLRLVLKAADEARKPVEAALLGAEVEGSLYVTVSHSDPGRSFDKDAFGAAHPRITARYTVEKSQFSRRFNLGGIRSHAVDIDSAAPALSRRLALVEKAVDTGASADALHRRYLDLVAARAPLDWERDLLEARLQAACGEHDGIDGICSWPRVATTTSVLDTASLKSERPELYERFMREGSSRRSVSIATDLGRRLPRSAA